MLSTVALVAALSTGHKIGLAVVGGAFIAFALISSFVIPRWNANFPGRSMGWYIAACVLFFLAMVSAVVVFGRETPESQAKGETTTTVQAVTTTSSPPTTTAAAPAPGSPKGNAAAGKAVFASAGCSGCHTLKAAGATGTVGPNLDQLKPPYDRIVHQVEVGGGPMPAFKGQLTDTQIADVAAYVFASTHSG